MGFARKCLGGLKHLATINQLRQERLAYFRELKRTLRPVDTSVEKMERAINRIVSRTRDVPEVGDYQLMVQQLEEMLALLVTLEKLLQAGRAIFSILA